MHIIFFDSFGNCFIECDEDIIDVNCIRNLIGECRKPGKGVILIGFSNEIINELNKFYEDDIIFLTGKYHLLINGSNCPQFINERVYGAGISIIVRYHSKNYAVLMKNKNKKALTCISGFCELDDFKNFKNYFFEEAAMRELGQETYGKVVTDNKIFDSNGLCLMSHFQLYRLVEMEMQSSYYGINVLDSYNCLGFYIDLDNTIAIDPFYKLIFNSENELPDGNYKMDFHNHPETEYIYAINLVDSYADKLDDFESSMQLIIDKMKSINISGSKISCLHMFFNYIHLNNLKYSKTKQIDEKVISDLELFAQLGLLSTLRKLNYFVFR